MKSFCLAITLFTVNAVAVDLSAGNIMKDHQGLLNMFQNNDDYNTENCGEQFNADDFEFPWKAFNPIWAVADPSLRSVTNIAKEVVKGLAGQGLSNSFKEHNNYGHDLKGPEYIALSRQDKSAKIWERLIEDTTPGLWHIDEIAWSSNNVAFEHKGDEFDCHPVQGCHHKTIHGVGSVGKVIWKDLGSHPYTGAFKGGDSGFMRLGNGFPTNADPPMIWPGIAVKILRDGMDSANIVAIRGPAPQNNFNFFQDDFGTHSGPDPGTTGLSVVYNIARLKKVTDFIGSQANSEFASIDQNGTVEDDPVFPFNVRFHPTGEFNMPEDNYDQDIHEWMENNIPEGSVLYEIYARDKPEELGGTELKIGELITDSVITASLYGDEHFAFRHQKYEDDLVYHPEWEPYVPKEKFFEPEIQLIGDFIYGCPFAHFFKGSKEEDQDET